MSDLGDAREALAGKVAAAGLRVSLDPRRLNPPCVLIGTPTIITRVTSCTLEEVVPVYAVAPPPGNADADAWLLATVETLFGVLTDATQAVPTTVTVGAADAPAYELETRLTV
jgi:hypothetical protein